MKKPNKKVVKQNQNAATNLPLPGPGIVMRHNKSVFFINPPDPRIADRCNLQDIRNMIGERGAEKFAKKRGQSGFKVNTNHSFWIKDLKGGNRIECVKTGSKTINDLDGVKTVPSFTPTRITHK